MSYATMNHAEWVQDNNAAGRRHSRPVKDTYGKVIGYHQAPEKLTDFQAKVMDIAGIMFGGIYNAPISWRSVDWQYGSGVSLTLKHTIGFATFDSNRLTAFVLLCHAARIRGEIEPGGWRSFRLSFWQRGTGGRMGERHPDIDEAVATFREYLPADHRIIYREPAETADE